MKKNTEYVGVDEKYIPEEEKYVEEPLQKKSKLLKGVGIGYISIVLFIFIITIVVFVFIFLNFLEINNNRKENVTNNNEIFDSFN